MRPQDTARAVLNGIWDASLPVNLVAIANMLGLKVFFSEELHDKSREYVE